MCLTSCVFNDFGGMFVLGAEFLHSEFKVYWFCICRSVVMPSMWSLLRHCWALQPPKLREHLDAL